jgi:AmmeMemoRadiSam system protein B
MLRQMAVFSPEGVLQAEQHGTGYACGAPAVAVALWAARELGADQVKLLHHSTSGDETGDYSSVVGYGAAVVLKIP